MLDLEHVCMGWVFVGSMGSVGVVSMKPIISEVWSCDRVGNGWA